MEDERRVSVYVIGDPSPPSGISSYWLERHLGRKRCRELDRDENERRDRDHIRRREYYSNGRKESRDTEARGYLERDKFGTNELVCRSISWEADRSFEGETSIDKNKDCDGKTNKNCVEIEEKFLKNKLVSTSWMFLSKQRRQINSYS